MNVAIATWRKISIMCVCVYIHTGTSRAFKENIHKIIFFNYNNGVFLTYADDIANTLQVHFQ